MPNTKILKENGQEFYPVTHASLIVGMENQGRMDATYAWDGTGTPDITKIPAGVVVTYDGTSYTGTLAASADTAGRFYLVPSTTVTGEYDRYLTDATGSTITWKPAGTTAIPTPSILDNVTSTDTDKALSANQGKLLKDDLSQLEAKVDSLPRGKDYGFFTSSSLLPSGATEEGFAYVGATEPYAIWQFDGTSWTDSGVTANAFTANNEQVQDAVDDYLDEHPTVSGTFLNVAKQALINLLEKVAFIDGHGQDYIDELTAKLYLAPIDHIQCVFTQETWACYDIYRLDQLKSRLVVTAYYTDGSYSQITDYSLSGSLVEGTSTITVSCVDGVTGDTVTGSFDVEVTGTTKLYVDGDECTALTGGWQKKGFNAASPTVTKNTDHILIKFPTVSGNTAAAGTLSTINKVDITGKTRVIAEVELYNASGVFSTWIYYPGTLAESTTQSGAFGSDYSSNRNTLTTYYPTSSGATTKSGWENRQLTAARTNAYISINANGYAANGSNYTAGAYLKVKRIALA